MYPKNSDDYPIEISQNPHQICNRKSFSTNEKGKIPWLKKYELQIFALVISASCCALPHVSKIEPKTMKLQSDTDA